MMNIYSSRGILFSEELTKLKKEYNTLSTMRVLVVLAFFLFGYYYLQPGHYSVYAYLMTGSVAVFIYLMKRHQRISMKKTRAQALADVNEDERRYLSKHGIPFCAGTGFINTSHTYSYDLDVFGNYSLYHNINRTETYKGSIRLAEMLLMKLPQEEILKNQDAIKELSAKIEWRQEIMALGKIQKDSGKTYHKLMDWCKEESRAIPNWINKVSYIGSVALAICLFGYFITGQASLLTYAGYLFLFNLGFVTSRLKLIKHEITSTIEIHEIIHRYGLIIEEIEKESFTSPKLIELQNLLKANNEKAGMEIKKLAELFSRMDSVHNLFALILFNGLFQFHLHTLVKLLRWKKKHSSALEQWIDVIAEIEALGSFANLYYNNPDLTFPKLNNEYKIQFADLSHPLLDPETRVSNNVEFIPGFMVLTGSNMSGKSTFLRSLGINMVLAGIGAPVCAKEANVHPLPVLVSMRLSDSLSDSESYFFAEIKRLKQIMDNLSEERAFVLLDEILRGTNSDDKRTGTIEVVKKMVAYKAIGAIATHDIEVCNTTSEYPEDLSNHCFEAQIVNNELYFDYKLRQGICRNKSATFLMEKMGVI